MESLTYSTVAVTLGLVIARPRLSARLRLTPSMAALGGVLLLALFGAIHLRDVEWAATTMWRPLLGILAIMVMTGVARRVGVLDRLADVVFLRAAGSPSRLFAYVFALGSVTSGVLNNDAAILLLTPLVVDAARKRTPALVVPFAFAVFLSAGVAPLMVSNPMNMVVATVAGIGFNEYAVRMAPAAIAGALVTFVVARGFFHRQLSESAPSAGSAGRDKNSEAPRAVAPDGAPVRFGRAQTTALVALFSVVAAYPIVSWLDGPVWAVAVAGAVVMLVLAARGGEHPIEIVKNEVHFDTLVFLVAVLILSLGLRNAGVVERLAHVYDGASPMRIGAVSALGSAILNNHPMANLNMLALGSAEHRSVLAALVGGDLGPRVFPMGSLAGLLWLEMLRRGGINVRLTTFVALGVLTTLPTLAVCLAMLF